MWKEARLLILHLHSHFYTGHLFYRFYCIPYQLRMVIFQQAFGRDVERLLNGTLRATGVSNVSETCRSDGKKFKHWVLKEKSNMILKSLLKRDAIKMASTLIEENKSHLNVLQNFKEIDLFGINDKGHVNLIPMVWLGCQSIYSQSELSFATLQNRLESLNDETRNFLSTPFQLDKFIRCLLEQVSYVEWKNILPCQICYYFFMLCKIMMLDTKIANKRLISFLHNLQMVNLTILNRLFLPLLTPSAWVNLLETNLVNFPKDICFIIQAYDTFHEESRLQERLKEIFKRSFLVNANFIKVEWIQKKIES